MPKIILIINGLFIILCNCLPNSIYPANNPNSAVVDSCFIGNWSSDGSDTSMVVSIELKKDNWYSIKLFENYKDVITYGKYLCQITKLDSFIIASIKADIDEIKDTNNITYMSVIPAYFFVKIRKENKDKISFWLFDFNKTKIEKSFKSLKINTITLESIKNHTILIDKTPEVRNFLEFCIRNNVGFEDKQETLCRINDRKYRQCNN